MIPTWLAISICVSLGFGPVHESVEVIELNHVIDECGKERLTQLIFWDGNVREWCLIDNSNFNRLPVVDGERYSVRYYSDGVHRHITSKIYRETFTHNDPERDDRSQLDERDRRKFYRVAK